MESNDTDAELLRRSVSEPAVFGELYERHGVAVRRYVVSRVGIYNGEDLAAEVFYAPFAAVRSVALSAVVLCPGCSVSRTM